MDADMYSSGRVYVLQYSSVVLTGFQADYVMVVGMGDDPSLGEYERLLLSMKTTARKELVLLHPDRSVAAGSTREWLKVNGALSLLKRC
jgi:hypothetical protein